MIPQAYIQEWKNYVPWIAPEQVEQDLIISRSLIQLYQDEYLSTHLAFRGGTAMHKLFLDKQPRYSEDIDLVQIKPEPIKNTLERITQVLTFIGKYNIEQTQRSNKVIFRFESEMPPVSKMKLKIEINTREHFHVYELSEIDFGIRSSWFHGQAKVVTYDIHELLGTKLRALYQRKKGRDLFDLFWIMSNRVVEPDNIINAYVQYMKFSGKVPSKEEYLMNIENKIRDPLFFGDTTALLRPDIVYDHLKAFEFAKVQLIEKM